MKVLHPCQYRQTKISQSPSGDACVVTVGVRQDRFHLLRSHRLRTRLAILSSAVFCVLSFKSVAELPVPIYDNFGAPVFQGASIGVPFNNSYGGQTVDIFQQADRAILDWNTFNISQNSEVVFNQPRPSSIALNRVLGNVNAASIINGRITANGRVYIINHDGVVFGKNSIVDTRSFIASTLDISDDVFLNIGIENAARKENGKLPAFFDNAGRPMGEILVEQGAIIKSAENGRVMMFAPRITNKGNIESLQGQIILAAAEDEVYLTPADENSDIRGLLVAVATGGDVTNIGSLVAERGNISLMGLAVNQQGLARATTSVSLNGSIVLKAQDFAGAKNGSSVNSRPDGSAIFRLQRGGVLTLADGSVTEVLPDDSDATAPDAAVQKASVISLEAEKITLKTGSLVKATGGDVFIKAFSKPIEDSVKLRNPADPTASQAEVVVESGAVIDVSGDKTTVVSVARNFVEVEARGNELADSPLQQDGAIRNKTLTVDMRKGTDFLNIDGVVAAIERGVHERLAVGGTVDIQAIGNVDIQQGAVIDISGGSVSYAGSTVSPTLLVTAGGEVHNISEADPKLIYSGVFGDFTVEHEKWGITEQYKTPFGYFEQGYVEGRDAGALKLAAPGINLKGNLIAETTVGVYQRFAPDDLGGDRFNAISRSYNQVPLGGKLVIQHLNNQLQDLVIGEDDGAVVLENGHPGSTANALVLSPDLFAKNGVTRIDIANAGRIILNRNLTLDAFAEVDLLGTQILVQSDIHSAGGQVRLISSPDLDGVVVVDEGLGDEFSGGRGRPIGDTSLVKIDATIDLAGRWINDSVAVNSRVASAPIITRGGSLTVESDRDVILTANSLVDVSGGAYLDVKGKLSGGTGGDITLKSVATSNANEKELLPVSALDIQGELKAFGVDGGGKLVLDAESILIQNALNVVPGYALDGSQQFSLVPDASGLRNVLLVNADTFQRGGFQSYTLNAVSVPTNDGLNIAADSNIVLATASTVFDATGVLAAQSDSIDPGNNLSGNNNPLELIATGTALGDFTDAVLLPEFERKAVDLALTAKGVTGSLQLGTGASIISESPGSVIRLQGQKSVYLNGTISAPAGEIDVALTGSQGSSSNSESYIWLGEKARLLAPGMVKINPVNDLALRTGEVLDAGSVTIAADYGAVFGAEGAVISVDAVSAQLDIGFGLRSESTRIDGAAGVIKLSAAESLVYKGSLSGQAAADRQGGQLLLTLDPSTRGATTVNTEGGEDLFYRGEYVVVFDDFNGALPTPGDALTTDLVGHAYVPLSQLSTGGFSSLDVRVGSAATEIPDTAASLSVVEFVADTQLTLKDHITLDAAVIRATNGVSVELAAPYVALGSTQDLFKFDNSEVRAATGTTPGTFIRQNNLSDASDNLQLTPTPGDGRLRVEGNVIDLVGELITEGIGRAGRRLNADAVLSGAAGVTFVASEDVRLRGIRLNLLNSLSYDGLFRTAGDVSITAQRVYPVTVTDFDLSVVGENGSIEFNQFAGAEPVAPLSLGGSLTVNADYIQQGSNLYAPLGKLALNAGQRLQLLDGSLTSSSGFGVAAPFFTTQPGGDLVLPGRDIQADIVFVEAGTVTEAYQRALPEQFVLLDSPNVDVQKGARFDVRGGSDARSTEFIKGPGGSRDILLADLDISNVVEVNKSFSILPGISTYAPYDPLLTPKAESVQGYRVGDTIVLEEGIDGLPAGEYAILPARYALFGGYLVSPVAGTQDFSVGLNISRSDGSRLLVGRYGAAGSDVVSSRSQAFVIADGDIIRARAEYLETPLADLYTGGNSRAPDDAGTLSIEAQNSLQLAGKLVQGGSESGRGSQVNIVADIISVINAPVGSGVELQISQLEQLGADSLLIGGRSRTTAEGLVIESVASEVNVAADVDFDAPELILVADVINMQSGARLQSSASASGDSERLIIAGDAAKGINGDAAVLAVSNRTLTLERVAPTGTDSGQLTVSKDAVLQAEGSVVADVAGLIQFNGNINTQGGLVNLGASKVSLGETDGKTITTGLVLSNSALAGLDGSRLRLRSDNTIDIYGRMFNADSGADLLFTELNLDAKALVGVSNDNRSTQLKAETIRFSNSTGSELADASATANASALNVSAGKIYLDKGRFKVQGFDIANMVASDAMLLSGKGGLIVEAPLSINAPVITATTGADYTIAAQGGKLSIAGADRAAMLPAEAGLAATLDLQGEAIDYAGRIVLASGRVTLHQMGDINNSVAGNNIEIAAEAIIDVSGVAQAFGPETFVTGGGIIHLLADTGDINFATGSELNISAGAAPGEAGSVYVETVNGTANLSSGTVLIADGNGGNFVLDSNKLVANDIGDGLAYTELGKLLGSGFSDQRHVRLRNQKIIHDSSLIVKAHDVRLVSDNNDVVVRGTIDASGQGMGTVRENGGSILIAAGDSVNIESTAILLAKGTLDDTGEPATGTHGGKIEFIALDADKDDVAAVNDRVNLKAGAVVDVSGGANPLYATDDYLVTAEQTLGGKVLVYTRMLDTATGDFVQAELNATITGAAVTDLIATNIIDATDAIIADFVIDAADIVALHTVTESFMQNAVSNVNAFKVTPGLIVESAGSLTLKDEWNFYGVEGVPGDPGVPFFGIPPTPAIPGLPNWHFGKTSVNSGTTGYLALRAAGDITLEADLTDSYFDVSLNFLFGGKLTDRLDTSTQAWDFNVVAGSDLGSADIRSTNKGSGNLQLLPGVVVRTGTGDLDVLAGNNILLDTDAAIYTGGRDRGIAANIGEILAKIAGNVPDIAVTAETFVLNQYMGGGAIFPVDGGDLNVFAGGSILAQGDPVTPTDWQPRIGESGLVGSSENLLPVKIGAVPTNWGLAFDRFSGIGALGGGNMAIRAGGDVDNIALAIPTTGRTIAGAVSDSADPKKFGVALETTEVAGGGIMRVDVGGDLNNAQFYLGDGIAEVNVAGNSGTDAVTNGTEIFTGFDSQFKLNANKDVVISRIQDPGKVALSDSQSSRELVPNSAIFYKNAFFTYSETTSIDVRSLSGDMKLATGSTKLVDAVTPVFSAISYRGDLFVNNNMVQYPSPQGRVVLLAGNDLKINTSSITDRIAFTQSDQDVNLFSSIQNPDEDIPESQTPGYEPLHINDPTVNLLVAKEGSIDTASSFLWQLNLVKATYVEAGRDIKNLLANVQNNRLDDVSSFIAGRDIEQPTNRGSNGKFLSLNGANKFEISGPGTVEFLAGRNINLGTSDGIETTGNINNQFLSEKDGGANLILMAGLGDALGGKLDAETFIQKYLVDGVDAKFFDGLDVVNFNGSVNRDTVITTKKITYQKALGDYLVQRGSAEQKEIDEKSVDVLALFRSLKPREQRPLFSDILFAELRTSGTYAQKSGTNDFSRGFDVIKTLFPDNNPEGGISMLLSQAQTLDGGDVDILVPGGLINAGAANSDIIDKSAADLGIVAAKAGNVNVMVNKDLLVNSTRVFALDGNLTVWSSNGNIDAGKGAKTVASVADPITRIGPSGEVIVEFPPAFEGSGLKGADVFLFAPKGVINAGDAGIVSTGDLTLGATAVIGSDNIDVGGASVGVPTASAGVGAGVASAGDATKSATDVAATATDFSAEDTGSTTLGILSVNVEGFGGSSGVPKAAPVSNKKSRKPGPTSLRSDSTAKKKDEG